MDKRENKKAQDGLISGDLDCYHDGLAYVPGCARHKFCDAIRE